MVVLEKRLEEAHLHLSQQKQQREEEVQHLCEEANALEKQLVQERGASLTELQCAQQHHQQKALQLAEALQELELLKRHSAALQEEVRTANTQS